MADEVALSYAFQFCDFVECGLDPRGAASVIHAQIAEIDRLTVERDRARDVAVALKQELARVLDLSRGWDELARNVKNPHLAYNEGWADAKFGCADDIQRLLGDETENQQ